MEGTLLKTNGIKLDVVELSDNIKISIFPNPASEKIYFNFNNISKKDKNEINFELYNIQGKSIPINKNVESIDVSEFPKGVYILKITNNKSVYSKKVIIK